MENARLKNGVTVGLNYSEKFQNRLARGRDVAQMHKLQDSRLQLSKQNKTNKLLDLKSCWNLPITMVL